MSTFLHHVRRIGRTLFLNNDPGFPHLLPLDNGYSLNDLADEICRGCAYYGLKYTRKGAEYSARELCKSAGRNDTHLDGEDV